MGERRDEVNNEVKTLRRAEGGRGAGRHGKGRTSLWKKSKSRDTHRFCLNFCWASFIHSIDISRMPTLCQAFF